MISYKEEKKYVGNTDQLFNVKRIELLDGKSKGVEMINVQNHSGMNFDVNISRGMDIPYLNFCGENIGYISPSGIVSPQYFDDKGLGFLKSFTAGFLTTCGLKNIGVPNVYDNTEYGLHGNISNTPSEFVNYKIIEDDIPYVDINGVIKDSIIFGDRLKLERRIRCFYREKSFQIYDTVTNEGFKSTRHMILYHFNIGYPILSPESKIYIPSETVKARDDHAKKGIYNFSNAELPDPNYREMCFYHKLKSHNNKASVAIYNDKLNIGIALEIDTRTLDHFVQWKMMGAGDYVMGLEPGNSTIDGIDDAINNGSIKYIESGEKIDYNIGVKI